MLKSLNWIIAENCNSKCIHCDIWKNSRKEITLEKANLILDNNLIKKSYEQLKDKFDISLGGGEPFLIKNFIEIVNLIEKKYPNSLKTISTNGLLTDIILDFIKSYRYLNIKLNISVDGIGDIHDNIRGFNGAFKKTINTIIKIKKLYPYQKIELKLTLLPKNFNQILKVYKLSIKLGCDFSFKPVENMVNYTNSSVRISKKFNNNQLCIIRNHSFLLSEIMFMKGNYKKSKFFRDIPFYLSRKKIPKRCSVLNDHITIMPNGDYFFCIKENKLGNILESSLKKPNYGSKFECRSCMLMCGSYKDYTNDFFENKTANFETTLNCNLKCEICTQKHLRKNKTEDMNFKTFKNIIDNKNTISHVSFVGGEPFLNKDFFDIMEYLDTKGMTYEITSNGTLITENIKNKLKNCIGLKKINFSLDGLKKYHDNERGEETFDRCFNSILLLKNLFNLNINTILKNNNLDEIPKLTNKLIKFGVKSQKIIYEMNLPKEDRENSLKIIKNLKIQGPNFNNQKKDHKKIKNLFNSLHMLERKNPINIYYEPKIFKTNLDIFLEGKSIEKLDVSCKQLNQFRFDNKGKRIICEFIRNKYSLSLSNNLNNKLLPICKNCCKLSKGII